MRNRKVIRIGSSGPARYAAVTVAVVFFLLGWGCSTLTLPDPSVYGERFTAAAVEAAAAGPVRIVELVPASQSLIEAADGSRPGWMELAVSGSEPVRMGNWRIAFKLDDGTELTLPRFPDFTLRPGEYRVVYFVPSGAQVAFPGIRITTGLPDNLAAIELLDSDGRTADRFAPAAVPAGDPADPPLRGYGFVRDPQLPASIRISSAQSPGMPNDALLPPPVFARDSGFFGEAALLDFIGTEDYPGWQIRYTINDGLEFNASGQIEGQRTWTYPTNEAGLQFNGPVALDRTSVIKARWYSPTGAAGPIESRTYFVGEQTSLPVFSITMDPADLWSEEHGLQVIGNDPAAPNFREKWFRLARMEFFGDNSRSAPDFADTYLARLYGSSSRAFLQRSFAFYAKAPASTRRIPNLFYSEGSASAIPDFYSIVLRNSGGDVERTMFRDGLMTGLATGLDVEKQDFQPSIVFLNGQYWGILNIREKINEYFLEDHLGIDPDAVDIVEGAYEATFGANEGSLAGAMELIQLTTVGAPVFPELFAEFSNRIDIDSLIDYFIIQTFINNTDWPWSNAKFWRSAADGFLWRWILYDTDAGFDTVQYWTSAMERVSGTPDFNMVGYVLSPEFNNDVFSRLFKNMIRNEDFFRRLIRRYRELLDTAFTTGQLLAAVDRHVALIEEEMVRHTSRWREADPVTGRVWNQSFSRWLSEVEILREFARQRPGYVSGWLDELEAGYTAMPAVRIAGGDFEANTSGWNLGWSTDRTEQGFVPSGDPGRGAVGRVLVTEARTNFWDTVAFARDDIFVSSGERLTFSFDARTAGIAGRSGEVMAILFDPSTNRELFSHTFTPGTQWRTEQVGFVNSGSTLFNARLQFRIGRLAAGQELLIDNVRLE